MKKNEKLVEIRVKLNAELVRVSRIHAMIRNIALYTIKTEGVTNTDQAIAFIKTIEHEGVIGKYLKLYNLVGNKRFKYIINDTIDEINKDTENNIKKTDMLNVMLTKTEFTYSKGVLYIYGRPCLVLDTYTIDIIANNKINLVRINLDNTSEANIIIKYKLN